MEDKLLSSDLEELKNACMAIEAEDLSDEINFCIPQDTDEVQVLSPGREDHDYFIGANEPYVFADQDHASKAFMDNDWQPPVQNFQKESNADKYSCNKFSAHFQGEDLQPIYNESDWTNSLSIKVRVPNISPSDLGIHFVSQKPPENIFGNQPSSQFIPGKVSYTKEECLHEFLMELVSSSHTQGCVLKEELAVSDGQYTEGKQLIYITSLYNGAYGKVDRCQDFVSGYEFIRKKIPLDKFRPTEVSFPLTMKHANIMKICGVIQRVEVDGGNVMEILMDNAGMSLVEFVKKRPENETLSQTLIWDLTKQALEGLNMLHRERIIHMDIKPENLCVQEDNRGFYVLTITDFGSAMKVNQEMDFVGWTPEYLAPESCRCYLQHSFNNGMFSNTNNQITGKVDVFALGLTVLFLHQKKHVLLNLLTEGQNSYNGLPMEKKKLLQLQLLLYLAYQEDPVGHLISDGCSTDMRDLLSRMLCGSADIRPTAGEALAYMAVREKEVDQILSQSSVPKPEVFALKRRTIRGRHNPSNPQFKTDKGQLVTQPSCSSSDYTPKMAEVPVSRLSLPKSINSLPDNEPGPIKDRMLKQRLREKLNPYLKTKIWVPKETEASNPTPMDEKNSCSAYTQPPASVAMVTSKMESYMTEMGHNITHPEDLGVTLHHQIPDTKPVQPSSPTDQSSNMVALCGNIPNFDVLVNI
ncbi:hypothetical protein CHS0354_031506 [Potamilus streckersoni]|uniref:Protein kinase domain-containing protein n=1 Tax=Potamilus streckersoni TaxID=2493646 RepID=A0AAE0SID1_9BIVA|nr:hypothetical protein CHS0354_031506 [Potamilus streckersoni]